MHFDDGGSSGAAFPAEAFGDAWIEVTGPIADALGALAKAIQHTPGSLAGASIAVTEHETLLLNERAWTLFAGVLTTLPHLVARPAPDRSKPLRFLLIGSGDDAPSGDGGGST
jgi:hypothetical protein